MYSQSGQHSEKYFPFPIQDSFSFSYSVNDISSYSTEKALYQNVEKHLFSAHSTKMKKTAPIYLNSDNFIDSHQISKVPDISSMILVSLKKAEGLVFNRGSPDGWLKWY
jgi:hypothetical protein